MPHFIIDENKKNIFTLNLFNEITFYHLLYIKYDKSTKL